MQSPLVNLWAQLLIVPQASHLSCLVCFFSRLSVEDVCFRSECHPRFSSLDDDDGRLSSGYRVVVFFLLESEDQASLGALLTATEELRRVEK